jgi:hypothetical protein
MLLVCQRSEVRDQKAGQNKKEYYTIIKTAEVLIIREKQGEKRQHPCVRILQESALKFHLFVSML